LVEFELCSLNGAKNLFHNRANAKVHIKVRPAAADTKWLAPLLGTMALAPFPLSFIPCPLFCRPSNSAHLAAAKLLPCSAQQLCLPRLPRQGQKGDERTKVVLERKWRQQIGTCGWLAGSGGNYAKKPPPLAGMAAALRALNGCE
jgi:hypothetical protein